MIEGLFVLFYGLILIGSLFMCWVWGRVAWKGVRHQARLDERQPDAFTLVAIGLLVGAFSNVTIYLPRIVTVGIRGSVERDIVDQPFAAAILFGLGAMALSKGVLMLAYDPTRKTPSWRWYAVLSVAWMISATLWAYEVIL